MWAYIHKSHGGRIGVGPLLKNLAWLLVMGSKPIDPKHNFETCHMFL
jgi:hypothetical protein